MSVTFAVGEASSAHAKSEEISNDWLDRLTVPPTNITYNSYRIAEINRTSESITPIEFVFPGSREYLDSLRKQMEEVWQMRIADYWLLMHFTQSSYNLLSRQQSLNHRTDRYVCLQSLLGNHPESWNRRGNHP